MDIQAARIAITVIALLAYLGIVAWAWNARRKPGFEEAARIPFDEDDFPGHAGSGPR